MIKMKTIVTTIIILISQVYVFSQISSVDNYERYWHYRNRLKYFVKVGTNSGESCISSYRNQPIPSGLVTEQLHYGDHTAFFGWYIGVLATEYKLLQLNGQNTDKTTYELYCAMEAYKRFDMCEDETPWNDPPGKFDGFFMTDDVDDLKITKSKILET